MIKKKHNSIQSLIFSQQEYQSLRGGGGHRYPQPPILMIYNCKKFKVAFIHYTIVQYKFEAFAIICFSVMLIAHIRIKFRGP